MADDKGWIVWTGGDRVEGVFLRDEGDAFWTATGNDRMLSCEGVYPTLGECLRKNAARGGDLPIDEVDLSANAPKMLPAPAGATDMAQKISRLISLLPEDEKGLVDVLRRIAAISDGGSPSAFLCADLRFGGQVTITRDESYAMFLKSQTGDWKVTPLYEGLPEDKIG